jgi:hypothetical protein
MKPLSPESWLTPPVSAECAHKLACGQKRSWMEPTVATPSTQAFGVGAPKRTQTTGRTWLQPTPGISDGCDHTDSTFASGGLASKPQSPTEATVELTLSGILVSTALGSQKISELQKVQAARLRPILQSTCMGKDRSLSSTCSRCTGAIDTNDAILFCTLFNALTRDEQVNLLHGLYSAANLPDQEQPSRVQWCFLGHPVCVQRLSGILGISKRTLYKRFQAA